MSSTFHCERQASCSRFAALGAHRMTEPRPRGPALIKAFLGSFAVYLLPIVSPHIAMIWGVVVVMEVASAYRREPLWLAVDLTLAVLLQAAAFLLLYWMLRRPAWWRIAIPAAAAPVFFIALLSAYMWLIPVYFLVEDDTAPAIDDWPVICTLPEAWLDAQRSQIDMSNQAAMNVWITRGGGADHLILEMPDCVTRSGFLLSLTGSSGIDQVTPAGDVLYRIHDKDSAKFEHRLLAAGAAEAKVLTAPPGEYAHSYWAPVLSVDGTALAWLERVALADGTRQQLVRTRDVASGMEQTHHTRQPIRDQLELLYYDSRRGEFLFSRYPNEVFGIDTAGHVTWGPVRIDGIESVDRNVRRLAGGWVAWEAYREQGRYRIVWSLPGGGGFRDVPKGRHINSVSTTVSGDLIAVSVTGSVSIGNIESAVFVFRSSDSDEVFRRYLPRHTSTPVQFLGDEYLAMSTQEENGKGRVVVLQVLR